MLRLFYYAYICIVHIYSEACMSIQTYLLSTYCFYYINFNFMVALYVVTLSSPKIIMTSYPNL